MDREIKFRAWDKDNGVFQDGMKYITTFFDDKGKLSIGYFPKDGTPFVHFELMQFTGIKDYSGKEIYEGDILSFTKSKDYKYMVRFDEGEFCLYSEFGRWGSISKMRLSCDQLDLKLNIIGNIYENSELFKITNL